MRRNAMIIILALIICACSKSPEKTLPGDMTINLAYATIPHAALVQIALEKGYFTSLGLTVNARAYDFGKPALASVFAGDSDLATCADTPIVFAALEGKPVGISAVIATSDRTTALVADRSAGIERPGDLAGKAIGVTKGTSAEFFLELLLVARGVNRDRTRIMDLLPDDMIPALRDGRIQAAAVWSPYVLQLQEALGMQAVTMYGEDFYTEQFYLAGNKEFIRTHPEAMQALMKALMEAETFKTREPAAAEAILSGYTKTDVPKLKIALDLFRFRVYLDGSLLTILEEETRWATSQATGFQSPMPDYMKIVQTEALSYAAPDRVRLIR